MSNPLPRLPRPLRPAYTFLWKWYVQDIRFCGKLEIRVVLQMTGRDRQKSNQTPTPAKHLSMCLTSSSTKHQAPSTTSCCVAWKMPRIDSSDTLCRSAVAGSDDLPRDENGTLSLPCCWLTTLSVGQKRSEGACIFQYS